MLYSILREDELFFLWKKRLGMKILSSLRYVSSAKNRLTLIYKDGLWRDIDSVPSLKLG